MNTKQKQWECAMYENEIASAKDELVHAEQLAFGQQTVKDLKEYIAHLEHLIDELDNE